MKCVCKITLVSSGIRYHTSKEHKETFMPQDHIRCLFLSFLKFTLGYGSDVPLMEFFFML